MAWLVALYETVVISYRAALAVYEGVRAVEFARAAKLEDISDRPRMALKFRFHCWQCIYKLLHRELPELGRFSALKALYSAHPAFIKAHIQAYAKAATDNLMSEGIGTWVRIVGISIFMFLSGIMGIFAFVWKFLEMGYMYMASQNRFFVLLSILNYLNQTLNIIDVERARQDRIFLFMFGGEDAELQIHEMERKEAYLVRVMYVIYDSIGRGKKQEQEQEAGTGSKVADPVFAVAAMVTFNNLDVQRLVVTDVTDEKAAKRYLPKSLEKGKSQRNIIRHTLQ
jgi:hypothetical protein